MSRPQIPSVAVQWLVPVERRQEVLIISEAAHWISHWDVNVSRSRRCGGSGCLLCSYGCKRQLRVVVMAVDGQGRDVLLELRERHRELFDRYESLVGLRVTIKREGTARNSPVSVSVVGQTDAYERDISRLVESLGLPAVRVREGSTSELRPGSQANSLEPEGFPRA